MAVVEVYLTFTRLDTGAAYVAGGESTGDVISAQRDRVLDNPEHIHIELPLLSDLAIAIVHATGGPSGIEPLIPLFGELSFDGGVSTDVCFVLVSAQRSMDPSRPRLIIDQYDLSVLYSVVGTDRETFVGVAPDDVMNAPAGTLPRPRGSIGAGDQPTWPGVKGLYQTHVGLARWAGKDLLQMRAQFDAAIANDTLSLDINAASVTTSTQAAARRMAGAWHPSDTAPAGSRAHTVSFTGDAARNPDGLGAKVLAIGRVGSTPRVTFDSNTPGTWDETTTIRFSGTGLAYNPAFSDIVPQVSLIGGQSNHGLSDGSNGSAATTITALVVVNTQRGFQSTRWDDNLLIVGTTSGVYYHVVGSGFLVPMSPVIAVNAMAYNSQTNEIVIATPSGVFSMSATPPAPFKGALNPLTRVGAMTFGVDDLWLDSTGNILIRVGGNQVWKGASVDGIYCFPALAGDSSGDTQGYGGYSRVAHSSTILAAGGNVNDIYYTDQNKAGTVYHLQPGSTTAPVGMKVADGLSVTGIDTVLTAAPGMADPALYQRVFVRTNAGSAGLYSITVGTSTMVNANTDGSLRSPVDDSDLTGGGSPVQIRKIVPSGKTIMKEYVFAFAATDSGVFRTGDYLGNGWSAPNAASGLGDYDISFVACGTAQQVLGHFFARLFAGSANQLLVSSDVGDSWVNLLAAKLDMGAAWYRRAVQWGGQWPDNNVGGLGSVTDQPATGGGSAGSIVGGGAVAGFGALGNLSPLGETGGSGTILPPPSPAVKGALPTNVIRARRLDEQQHFTFRMVDLASNAMQPGILYNEVSDLQANADVGVITASEQVELVAWRELASRRTARFQIPLAGSFTQTNAAARDLAPTDMARFRYSPSGWTAVMAMDMNLFVLSHSIMVSGGLARTTTTIANSLESSTIDPNAWVAAQEDKLTKRIRWGSA